MAVSKWKIAKQLFPLVVLVGVGLISKSWSPKIAQGQILTIRSNPLDSDQKPEGCWEKWKHMFPSDSVIDSITKQLINNRKGVITPFGQNEKLLELLPRDTSLPLFYGPLMGVFDINDTGVAVADIAGIFDVDGEIKNSPDVQVLNDSDIDFIKNSAFGEVIVFPNFFDVHVKGVSIELSLYTSKNSYNSRLKHLKYQTEACDDFIYYVFEEKSIDAIQEPVLFAATLPIEMEYETFPEIDQALRNYLPKENCLDCPNSLDKMKTFGKLKGFKNIYFVYADEFPSNEEMNEPARGLVFMEKGVVPRFLWYKGIDLFGCSCL